jgi:hypothetical protein
VVDAIHSMRAGCDDKGRSQLIAALVGGTADLAIEQMHAGSGLAEQPVVRVRGMVELRNWWALLQSGRQLGRNGKAFDRHVTVAIGGVVEMSCDLWNVDVVVCAARSRSA